MSSLRRATWMTVGVGACLIAVAGCREPQMGERVDPASIRSIKIGMTEQEVIAILGRPLQIRPWGEDANIYDYAIRGWASTSAALWIYFQKGEVQTVHGHRYSLVGEDHAVYEARADRPTFETPDFEATFTRALR